MEIFSWSFPSAMNRIQMYMVASEPMVLGDRAHGCSMSMWFWINKSFYRNSMSLFISQLILAFFTLAYLVQFKLNGQRLIVHLVFFENLILNFIKRVSGVVVTRFVLFGNLLERTVILTEVLLQQLLDLLDLWFPTRTDIPH